MAPDLEKPNTSHSWDERPAKERLENAEAGRLK
jgi:hypothetical protein